MIWWDRAVRLYPRRIRSRLTLAFVGVLALVLGVCGVVVYHQYSAGLETTIDEELLQREHEVRDLARRSTDTAGLIAVSGERLLQLYTPQGSVVGSSHALTGKRLLSADEVRRVDATDLSLTTDAADQDDAVRVRAFALPRSGEVAAVGESLARSHRDQHRLALLLALVLPGALALASYAGYLVAGAALRPVDRMRDQADGITDADLSERLPVPATDDELERLGTTLNAMLERVDTALERERRLVSDASHELRTPLTILRAELEVALDRPADAAALRATLVSSLEEVQRLSRVSEDLLVLARADQGRLPLRPEPLDVQDLLEAAVRRNAAAAADDGRALSSVIHIPGGAVVLADPDRTAQILDNLIANARRYGAGAIELEAAPANGDTHVALSVRDHGPGYPDDFAARAFDRFSQADAGRSGPNSGLGLAIVAALAAAQGGTATAANDPDGGARTTVTLPLA